jgi:glycosyltransferase involved in cell wall biosynthesis
MRSALERLGIVDRPIIVVEPGRIAVAPVASEPPLRTVNAIMVANLVNNKGVLALLHALWPRLKATDQFQLDIVGSKTLEPDYALECATWLERSAGFHSRVRLCGTLSATDVVSRMQHSNLFVSASFAESYGMALAEARTLALPIIAHRGGHVSSLVDPAAGGEIVDSVEQVAESLPRICRNPAELSARWSAARSRPLPARSWAMAASDFVGQLNVLMNERRNEATTNVAPSEATTKRQ